MLKYRHAFSIVRSLFLLCEKNSFMSVLTAVYLEVEVAHMSIILSVLDRLKFFKHNVLETRLFIGSSSF
jgi:hypothetical protein